MTNNCLKSEKGVTLLTLTIYIIVLTAIVGIMAGVSSLFYNNIGMMKDAAENAGDFDTLNSCLISDSKSNSVVVVDETAKTAGPSSAEGFLFLSPPVPADLVTERGKAFIESYKKMYNGLPYSVWALLAGDAFNVLVEALRNTDASSEAMAAYLKNNLKDYSGITGTFSFSDTGDRVGDLYQLYTVSPEGKFVIKQ